MATSNPEIEPESKNVEESPAPVESPAAAESPAAVESTSCNDEKAHGKVENAVDRAALENDPHRAAFEDNPAEPEKMTFMKGLALFVCPAEHATEVEVPIAN